jgi:hypothetical protein
MQQSLIETKGTRLRIPDWDKLKEVGEFDPTYLHLMGRMRPHEPHPSASACCREPAAVSEWMRAEPPANWRHPMHNRDEKIRMKAYEIWERQGRTGSPDDHWFEAERELRAEEGQQGASQDAFEATVEQASPIEALDPDTDSSAKGEDPPGLSKG